MKTSFSEVFPENLYSQSSLYKMYAYIIEWRLEKIEAWFYLSGLPKSLRILGQQSEMQIQYAYPYSVTHSSKEAPWIQGQNKIK